MYLGPPGARTLSQGGLADARGVESRRGREVPIKSCPFPRRRASLWHISEGGPTGDAAPRDAACAARPASASHASRAPVQGARRANMEKPVEPSSNGRVGGRPGAPARGLPGSSIGLPGTVCACEVCSLGGLNGAEGGTRTPTGCPTRPSNVRVCQFRHFGASEGKVCRAVGGVVKPPPRKRASDQPSPGRFWCTPIFARSHPRGVLSSHYIRSPRTRGACSARTVVSGSAGAADRARRGSLHRGGCRTAPSRGWRAPGRESSTTRSRSRPCRRSGCCPR
jgi:hypothetical protein